MLEDMCSLGRIEILIVGAIEFRKMTIGGGKHGNTSKFLIFRKGEYRASEIFQRNSSTSEATLGWTRNQIREECFPEIEKKKILL